MSDDYRAAFRALDAGTFGSKLRVSPGDLIRARFLRGDIDEAEAGRRLTLLAWMIALLFPVGLLAAIFALRMMMYGTFYPTRWTPQIAALLSPIGPLFAIAADRLIERPALRRAVERRGSTVDR